MCPLTEPDRGPGQEAPAHRAPRHRATRMRRTERPGAATAPVNAVLGTINPPGSAAATRETAGDPAADLRIGMIDVELWFG